ncbi:hypothetical protein D3C72_231290 [compost metagenome]
MASLRKWSAWLAKLSARFRRKPSAPTPEAIAQGHEGPDINYRVIGYLAIGIVVGAVLMHLALLLLMARFERQAQERHGPMPTFAPPETVFPVPRLQVDPSQDLERLRADEERLLTEYAWVDRPHGLIRIPIARAMDWLASPSASGGTSGGRRP